MLGLADIFADLNIDSYSLTKKQGYAIYNEWLALFASKVKKETGSYTIGGYVFHAYLQGILPSIESDQGGKIYHSKSIETYYLIHENGQQVFECNSKLWPNFHGHEMIVLPSSKSWSMVFSHEYTQYYVEPDVYT